MLSLEEFTNLMEEIRQAIKDDNIESFREEFIKNYYGKKNV